MRLFEYAFLTDENINAAVVSWLREQVGDVVSVGDARMLGRPDTEVLALSVAERRVLLTHDPDFGKLAVAGGEKVYGIVYLRPGHIDPAFTIASLTTAASDGPDLEPPFLFVIRRVGEMVTMRLRRLPSSSE